MPYYRSYYLCRTITALIVLLVVIGTLVQLYVKDVNGYQQHDNTIDEKDVFDDVSINRGKSGDEDEFGQIRPNATTKSKNLEVSMKNVHRFRIPGT